MKPQTFSRAACETLSVSLNEPFQSFLCCELIGVASRPEMMSPLAYFYPAKFVKARTLSLFNTTAHFEFLTCL